MNIWIIAAIVIGVLAVTGVFVVMTGLTTANQPEKVECKSCGGSCNADKNCGSETCGAVSGGSCRCGG